jgi:uncharacterized protein (DUF697 family)|tara:strand:+ start:762 stop:1268 length:507 start_codon:yes stop_codon:yes gene_type:complete
MEIENTEIIEENHIQASKIITKYLGWSAGAAFIPVPGFDLAAVTAVQIKMIADIAKVYDVPFKKDATKTIIGSLLATILPSGVAQGASSLVKIIPGIGTILGMATAPAFAAASTYAIGKVFTQHFESGGNLITFDTTAAREYFKAEYDTAVQTQKASSSSKASDSKAA